MNGIRYNFVQKYGRRTDIYMCHDCFLATCKLYYKWKIIIDYVELF